MQDTEFMVVIFTENREKGKHFREEVMNSVCDLLSLSCLLDIQEDSEQQWL